MLVLPAITPNRSLLICQGKINGLQDIGWLYDIPVVVCCSRCATTTAPTCKDQHSGDAFFYPVFTLLWGRSYDSYVWQDAIMEQFISMCSSERERCNDVPVEIGRDPIGSNANIQITYID